MFIAILDFDVAPDDRATVLAALLESATAVRAMPGNINFRPFLDPNKSQGICVLHEWTDQASFAAYGTSGAFASLGRVLRPLMTSRPVSRRLRADLVETVA
jgi:quinol monooxygenase YgiN